MIFWWRRATTNEVVDAIVDSFTEEEKRAMDYENEDEVYRFEDQIRDYFVIYYPILSLKSAYKYVQKGVLICKGVIGEAGKWKMVKYIEKSVFKKFFEYKFSDWQTKRSRRGDLDFL